MEEEFVHSGESVFVEAADRTSFYMREIHQHILFVGAHASDRDCGPSGTTSPDAVIFQQAFLDQSGSQMAAFNAPLTTVTSQ